MTARLNRPRWRNEPDSAAPQERAEKPGLRARADMSVAHDLAASYVGTLRLKALSRPGRRRHEGGGGRRGGGRGGPVAPAGGDGGPAGRGRSARRAAAAGARGGGRGGA